MKSNFYILALIAILGWGCSKNTEAIPEAAKYDVAFSMSGFETLSDKISPKRKQQSVTAAYNPYEIVSYVDLYVFNSKGILVAQIEESWADGTGDYLIEGLTLGNYTAIAVGHNGVRKTVNDNLSTASIALESHDAPYGEVFMDKVGFEVHNIENNQVDLVLQRKVGLLTVDIIDTPPSDVSYVRASVPSLSYVYSFNEFMPLSSDYYPSVIHHYYSQYDYFNMYFFVPNNSDSYVTSVLLEVVSTKGETLKSRWVNNVTVGTNIRTTIRGKLFDPNAQGFSVEIDTEWNGENTIEF